jgi:DNA-binding MarR family transcriptional regulator
LLCDCEAVTATPDNSEAASALATEIRALVGKLKRRLREQASPGDLTPSQISVLLRLEREGPSTTSNLARLEGMRPQSMGTVIAPLEAAGLVSGAPDPTDGRQTLLSLTDACRKLVEEGRAARQDWLTRMLQARLSPEELGSLGEAVALLRRLVDD